MTYPIDLPTEQASEQWARRLATCLTAPLTLTFSGDIGAGKTTLIRATLRAVGITAPIKSPTFSLVESYQIDRMRLHHFDLYRIHEASELEYIGFRDYFTSNAVCCIEWPERAQMCLALADVGFTLNINGPGRQMHARAYSPAGASMLSSLLGES
ncbi:MAG TPA: tRNA (adenosine(37)-N6)-threonylcarbamoyltransferase complex ATPase subunit type 1 TsaE [Legionella sp.]|nr:tRNA (adenosine(37)-N6)-threonylcarbamoyltransferase complex ATPase subunit type 1 TsaE [Legionella sp.]